MSDIDYEVFNPFLRVETWHTNSGYDDERFFGCLSKVVEKPDFSPDTMGEYMRDLKGVDSDEHHYAKRIDDLVVKAWAVREYLKVIDETSAYEDPDVIV